MMMTAEEIRRDHRLAKNPEAQVEILADINEVTPKIIRRIIAGQSIEEVMDRKPPQARKSRYVPNGKIKHWTTEEKERLGQMWREGCNLDEISAVLGRSQSSVKSALYQYKLSLRCKKKSRI